MKEHPKVRASFTVVNNYSPKYRWLAVDIYRAANLKRFKWPFILYFSQKMITATITMFSGARVSWRWMARDSRNLNSRSRRAFDAIQCLVYTCTIERYTKCFEWLFQHLWKQTDVYNPFLSLGQGDNKERSVIHER